MKKEMTGAGKTHKPCPLCKRLSSKYDQKNGYGYGRPTYGVCRKCQEAWDTLSTRLADLEAVRGPEIPVILYERDYGLPYIHHHGERDYGKDDFRERFQKVVHTLSMILSSHMKGNDLQTKSFDVFHGKYEWRIVRRMNPTIAVCLSQLYDLVTEQLDIEYKAGMERGHKLLAGLADGTITTEMFDDRVTETRTKRNAA